VWRCSTIPESPRHTPHQSKRPPPPNPQPIFSSPAAALAAVGPVPVASTRPLDPTPHAHAAFSVGVPAVARRPPASHAGRGEYSVSVLLSDTPLTRRRAPTRPPPEHPLSQRIPARNHCGAHVAFRNGVASPHVSRRRGRRLQGCPPLECSVRSDELPVSMRMRVCVVM